MRSAVSLMVAVYLELCVISWLGNFAPGRGCMACNFVGGGRG
jgi:hypothetical protein